MKVEWNPGVITEQIERNLMDRLEEAANLVATRAKQLCPVGTIRRAAGPGKAAWEERVPGTLRNSIRVVRLKGDPNQDVRVYAGARTHDKNEGYYAHMVEFGSVHNTVKPFLRPAEREIGRNIEQIIAKGGDVTGTPTTSTGGTWAGGFE
jgi:HK97 gp10 family phage protein